jgi:hypothetical protein
MIPVILVHNLDNNHSDYFKIYLEEIYHNFDVKIIISHKYNYKN